MRSLLRSRQQLGWRKSCPSALQIAFQKKTLHQTLHNSTSAANAKNVLIMGAAGRDFHNFNLKFKDNPEYNVVAFTATQIPGIDDRMYPPSLSGSLYPNGIAIHEEAELQALIEKHSVSDVIFAYSDVTNDYVMARASKVMAMGANFTVLGKHDTQLRSSKPVISVSASRTGCGKSQTSRYIVQALRKQNLNVVALRHPMPYGNLADQRVQRFATFEDLSTHECTIEEREEYEPYVECGCVVFAGVDYGQILKEAEKEADVILWDGGNNDMPFVKADIEVTVVDPHRPGHESTYYPGQTNVLSAGILLINKVDTASMENILQVRKAIQKLNPTATLIEGASPITVDEEHIAMIKNKRVLIVEDGPTLTHGGMTYGAGMVAAGKYGALEMIDPRPYLVGSMQDTFDAYPDIGCLLPAMGYGQKQVADLEQTVNNMAADNVIDVVVSGTPIDLSRVINVKKPVIRARYDLQCIGTPLLEDVIQRKLADVQSKVL